MKKNLTLLCKNYPASLSRRGSRYIVLSEAKPQERGAGQAIVNMLSSAGQLIGGALIGGVIASFSGILGYGVSLILAAIVGFIAFLFTFKLKGRDEQFETMKSNQ